MAVSIERESTEYLFTGITGYVPSVSAEVTFLSAGVRPTEPDWEVAVLVDTDSHLLWNDAVAAVGVADYYVGILVGSFGGTGVVLAQGSYQEWLRLTDAVERPVRIAPEMVNVL